VLGEREREEKREGRYKIGILTEKKSLLDINRATRDSSQKIAKKGHQRPKGSRRTQQQTFENFGGV